jgi:uncharacterized protein YjiS (DUF1127 family)
MEDRRMNANCHGSGLRRRPTGATAQVAVARFRLLSGIALAIVACPARVSEAVLTWLDRLHRRRTLDRLSDHTLKDIGLSRAAADREARRPFWRE